MATGLDPAWRPDIVHAYDWHAGLTCAYLAAKGRPAKSVFTVHNLAYQGLFSPRHLPELQLPDDFFQTYGLEFYGQISFLYDGMFKQNIVNHHWLLHDTFDNLGDKISIHLNVTHLVLAFPN